MSARTNIIPIHGEPSIGLGSDRVSAWVTQRGGMIGPVEFDLGNGRTVRPYSLSPWLPVEHADRAPPVVQVLRGDFFCFPFGENPGLAPHGPTANEVWQVAEAGTNRVRLTLDSPDLPARFAKDIVFRPGETNLYQRHEIVAEGVFNYGHHPVLEVPEGQTVEIRTSRFRFGSTYPGHVRRPLGERGALAPASNFSSLAAVPLQAGGHTSLLRFPVRPDCEDIVMLAGFAGEFAWTAVTFPGYVWFALRRVIDFPGTLFWMSDGGRSEPPWSGRHRRRIGIEDVCSHFCDGLELSRQGRLDSHGIATTREFDPEHPVVLSHVQGVVPVPAGFGGLASLEAAPVDRQRSVLTDEAGNKASTLLDWGFFDHSP